MRVVGNMTIISISINEKILKELDRLKDQLGFSGRSEVIRAAARTLLAENREKEALSGSLNSMIAVIHSKEAEGVVTEIKHEFEDIINTQIHNNLKGGKCLEIFILEGNAARVKQLIKLFQANRKIEYAKLIVA